MLINAGTSQVRCLRQYNGILIKHAITKVAATCSTQNKVTTRFTSGYTDRKTNHTVNSINKYLNIHLKLITSILELSASEGKMHLVSIGKKLPYLHGCLGKARVPLKERNGLRYLSRQMLFL